MATPRHLLVDEAHSGAYHLISRCVRRAYLCGDACEHRRAWVETGIETQAEAFAVDILAFAVMSNHLHIVCRTDPDAASAWSDREVVERWAKLFPARDPASDEPVAWDPTDIDAMAKRPEWVATRRARLASLSWFMRLLKQRIARRANREDGVTGHFWEGRFQSVRLLDQAAVVSCMAYCDLNPVRARMAETPEASEHTSVQHRIDARQAFERAQALIDEAETQRRVAPEVLAAARQTVDQGPEGGLWIAPMRRTQLHEQVPTISLDDYLELVDQTGRLLRDDKRGAIPAHLHPILERLRIDTDRWLEVMLSHGSFLGTAVGTITALATEALRRGVRWVADKTRIHRERRAVVA